MTDTPAMPFTGLVIVDLSTEIAGGYCTKLLADAGADVVKVEPPSGDPLRRWSAAGGELEPGEDGPLFRYLHTTKRSVVADLATPEGAAAVRGLVAGGADVVVESGRPGELEDLGLGHGQLAALRPQVSVVSITPWGRTGPYAQRPATEFTLQAETGSTAFRGTPDRPPVAVGGRLGEWVAGAFAAVGAATAWRTARQHGLGQHVDVSTFEAMLLCFQTYHPMYRAMHADANVLRRSVEIPGIEPASDGWIGLTAVTDQQWNAVCEMIERPDVAERYPGFARYVEGPEGQQEISGAIRAWTTEHTRAEIIDRAVALHVPVAPVGDGSTAPTFDQFIARGVFVRNPGGFVQPRVPYTLERVPARPFAPAPRLGEHTTDVLDATAGAPTRSTRRAGGHPHGRLGRDELPFAGLTVLDVTTFWAGPIATAYLAALGADVIKVESIQHPDGMRFAGGFVPPDGRLWEYSPVFHGANAGKRAVTLDLHHPDGVAVLKQLIARADVLVENHAAHVMDEHGLGWDQVRSVNPAVVMVRMPAFGLDGPWRDRVGFAMTVEQASGLAWLTGYPDRTPLVPRGVCDPLGGTHAVFALVAALEHRGRTGEGQLVEVPLVEPALNVTAELYAEYSTSGTLLTRDGNRGPAAAPQGVYPTAGEGDGDGAFVALAVTDTAQWDGLRPVLGNPPWTRAPELATPAGRRAAHDDMDAAIAEWAARLDREEAVEQLVTAGVPAAPVISARLLGHHPQLESRHHFQWIEHPVAGTLPYEQFPQRFPLYGDELLTGPAPTLGQDNDEILRGLLGLSDTEVQRLADQEVIGTWPTAFPRPD